MSFGFSYTFPALRGTQAGKQYYVAMCPLKLLTKIFMFDEASLPPELRAQRTLNTSRVPDIARYIVDNRSSYAFSAITASVDGEVRFEPASAREGAEDIGLLSIPMSARFVINDGQHRRAAIESALQECPELGEETISVVFFLDSGLKRSQQLFADLNKHAVKPTKSLSILYDNRDPLAKLSRDIAYKVLPFKGLTALEETTISNRSLKLFTLSAIYIGTAALLGKKEGQSISKDESQLAIEFWTKLGTIIPEWQWAAKREVSSSELRKNYVHVHSVMLHALGLAGHALVQTEPKKWPSLLEKLSTVDWSRSNVRVWEGRAMSGGKMSKARINVKLTATYFKSLFGLTLTEAEQKEDQLVMNYREAVTA